MKSSKTTDLLLVLTGALLVVTVLFGVAARRFVPTSAKATMCIVLDPGHGGEDGGASGADGTREKHLNLAVTQSLGDLLTVMGYTVVYTRTDDVMVNAVGDTLRDRKVSDMNNRLALIETADLAVSIHQNNFSDPQYSGTQVFYGGKVAESRDLAESIQQTVVAQLQPQNTRTVKAGAENSYLLKQSTRPTVLVECGFLSNVQERELLKTRTYQRQMAFAILSGIIQHLS